MDSLRISIGGKDLEPEQYKAEVSSGITLEKEHRSPDGDGHTNYDNWHKGTSRVEAKG